MGRERAARRGRDASTTNRAQHALGVAMQPPTVGLLYCAEMKRGGPCMAHRHALANDDDE